MADGHVVEGGYHNYVAGAIDAVVEQYLEPGSEDEGDDLGASGISELRTSGGAGHVL